MVTSHGRGAVGQAVRLGGRARRTECPDRISRGDGEFRVAAHAGHAFRQCRGGGGLLGAALKALLEIPAHRNPFALQNGSISRIEWRQEAKLLSLNETAHLQGQCGSGGDL